jgi:dipeptidyl aminopeptidase/acylaminoacyl peptidase
MSRAGLLKPLYATSLAVIFSVCAGLSPAAWAQKRPMTFDDLMAMHRISDPQPSPDGNGSCSPCRMWTSPRTRKSIICGLSAPTAKATRKSHSDTAGESRGRFSPDGKQVLFTSSMEGDEELYLAPFDSTAGTLGAAKKLTALSTGADGGMWSPDGQRILFL